MRSCQPFSAAIGIALGYAAYAELVLTVLIVGLLQATGAVTVVGADQATIRRLLKLAESGGGATELIGSGASGAMETHAKVGGVASVV